MVLMKIFAPIARIKAHKNNIVAILEEDAAIAAPPEPGQAAAIVPSDAKAALEERKGLPMGSAPQSKPAAAPWPEPTINGTPPFGSDEVPDRYEAEWKALLARCPPWVTEWQWTATIFDCGTYSASGARNCSASIGSHPQSSTGGRASPGSLRAAR
jgi:hypothetical protein